MYYYRYEKTMDVQFICPLSILNYVKQSEKLFKFKYFVYKINLGDNKRSPIVRTYN